MKTEWVSPVLSDLFLHIMIKEFGGYESNIRHVLVKNIYALTNILPKQEATESMIKRIDLIISIPQFGIGKECVEIKMYNFVSSVPIEIKKDMEKLAKLGPNILRTFLYFGYYGRYQNPQTNIMFDKDKRLTEIDMHCQLLENEYKDATKITPFVDSGKILFECPCTDFIYFAFWLSV